MQQIPKIYIKKGSIVLYKHTITNNSMDTDTTEEKSSYDQDNPNYHNNVMEIMNKACKHMTEYWTAVVTEINTR